MEKKIETTIILGLYIGVYIYKYIMEKKMETAMVGLYRVCVYVYIYILEPLGMEKSTETTIFGLYKGYSRENIVMVAGTTLDLTATGGAQIN